MTLQRPVRVFHLIESLGCGGAEQLLATTVRGLNPRSVASSVGYLFAPDTLQAALEQSGIPVRFLALRGRFDGWRGVLQLARHLREERIDVLHTHLFHANIYGRLAGWLAQIPVVTTHHSADYTYQETGRWTFKLRKGLDRWTARRLTRLHLAVSCAVQKDYQRHFGLPEVQLFYNCVDTERFHPDDPSAPERRRQWRSRCGCAEADIVFVQAGRLHPEKGQRTLIDAMKRFAHAAAAVRLVVAGTGSDEADLRRQVARQGLDPVVRFIGHQQDVRGLLSMADAFVLPSNIEGLPLSLLEAMACGLPVVATRVGGIAEVITDGVDGLLVPAGDPQALAEALAGLSQDEALRRRLAQEARRTIEKRFSAARQLPRLEALYARLAQPTSWGPSAVAGGFETNSSERLAESSV